ncbi:MAG TPA: DedA family protein, partial [Roseimicrobium sp.]|nr:DedA family protein [Roseimicrobium sp.]
MNDPFAISLPAGFTTLPPWIQAGVLGLLTFLQEDAPTIGSALLASVGTISWGTAFTGCFLGIWVGDALLYGLARGLGRGWLSTSWARRFWEPAAVERSERWFAERGNWLLVASRFVPGTRLPTYLAAGFLRMPFGQFLLVTGLAVGAWTTILFLLAWRFGASLRGLLPSGIAGVLALVTMIALMLWGWRRISRKMAEMRWIRVRTAVERWAHWEFWPAWLFYAPVVLNCLRLAVKYRGWTVPTAA